MQMDQAAVARELERIHLFQSFDASKLQAAAALIEVVEYPKDDLIFRQGDAAEDFYIIVSGQVRLICQPNNSHPSGQLGLLEEDDYFGEEVLETGWPRQTTVRTETDVTLLRISRTNFIQMLEVLNSKTFEKGLGLILNSYRMKLRKNFSWLEDEESIVFIARRDIIVLLRMLLKPTIGGLIILLMFFGLYELMQQWLTLDALIVAFVLVAAWWIYAFVDWTNDYYVITTGRVVSEERVILVYESRQESPLSAIQSSTIYTSQWGRWLNYGNVAIRTLTGTILFKDIANPSQVLALIQQSQLRAQSTARRMNIKDIKNYLTERIHKGPERATLPRPKPTSPPPDPMREFLSTMFHWRYEKGKTIIYRTNFFILIEKTALPLLLLLGLLGLFIFSARATASALSIGALCGVFGLFGLIVFGWLGYQYWDWHNDIYMITNDQIVDVNKRPLGQEERQAALIENIQSIEYKRLGIIGLLFNFGTVYIRVGDRQLTFDDVHRPAMVQRELFHALLRVRNDKRKKQAEEEKTRSGDWFDAFLQWERGKGSRTLPPQQGF